MQEKLMEIVTEKLKKKEETALVIITKEEGHSPRGVGTMMAVDSAGCILGGTIGGGAAEEKARLAAVEAVKEGVSKTMAIKIDLPDESGQASNCGGNIEVLIKVFKNPDKLLIIGAGHVGLALYKFAKLLGYSVTVLDNRPEFVTKERFPEAAALICGEIAAELKKYPIDELTSIVIITHGHQYDEIALEAVAQRPARYIGMIGNRAKLKIVFDNLKQRGIPEETLQKVFAPVGLNIGGDARAEVALSIIAQIQAVKYGRPGGFIEIVK
ncbi:MAG: XdhC/CoxI family protein [Clostridia bacterium]|jgi:xanthine dehydrogenase accessory factor|nr:XdhC/CoxI family protein [Clostridia bacterium]